MRRILKASVYRSRVFLTSVLGNLQSWESTLTYRGDKSDSTDKLELDGTWASTGIIITTFEERQFQYCLPLVKALREHGNDWPIVVLINGNIERPANDHARRALIRALADIPMIFPVSLREMVGLARLWNLGIQILNTEIAVILNDDLHVVSNRSKSDLVNLASGARESGLIIGNGSWSHFAVSTDVIRQVGWFDERLLGFGEEDGDFSWRYRAAMGSYPKSVQLQGIVNAKANSHQDVQTTGGKYSLVNRIWSEINYPPSGRLGGIEVEPPPQQVSPTPDLYPGERFRKSLNHLLTESDEAKARAEIRQWLESREISST
jgi:hypothetical protein